MRKKYRIRPTVEFTAGLGGELYTPAYIVQVRSWWGMWVNVKVFHDIWDPDFARLQAEELLEKLTEE